MTRRVALGLVVMVGVLAVSAIAGVEDLISSADAAFDRFGGDFTFKAYRQRLEEAIAIYEEVLTLIPEEAVQTCAYLLNRLSQGYFELAHAYLIDRDEREEIFGKGKDYALVSLRLDPEFRRIETESFRAALGSTSDVAAIFWYGNNLGRYLDFHPLVAITGGVRDVKAAFERAIELDETYLAGGPWRALGSFLGQVPSFLGGDLERAAEAFERAIELGPDYLENYVDYAEYYAKVKKNWDLFCIELGIALDRAANPEILNRWPLYNTLALERAEELVLLEVEGEPVCGE